ncbi:MAG: hypothetical protein R3Y46_08190 [Opitutales bacterium]
MIRSIYIPSGLLEYMLGDVDLEGRQRQAIILRGDLNAVQVALEFAKEKEHMNPVFVATFRDPTPLEELGGREFLEKLMDDVEESMYPRLKKDQFPYVFILHVNCDGSTELNLFAVNVVNQRQYTTYFETRDIPSWKILSELTHAENPKLVNPNAVENRRALSQNPYWNKEQLALFKEVNATALGLCEDKSFVENYSKSLLKTSLQASGFTLDEDSESRLFVKNDNAKIKLSDALLKKNPNIEKILYGTEETSTESLSLRERLEISNDTRSKQILKKYKHLQQETNEERNTRELKRKINRALGSEPKGVDIGDGEGRGQEAAPLGHQRDGQEGGISIPAVSKGTGDDSQHSSKGDKPSDAGNSETVEAEYPFGHEISSIYSNSSNQSSDSGGVKVAEEEKGEESPFIDEFLSLLNNVIQSDFRATKERKLEAKLAAEAKAKAILAAERAKIAQQQAMAPQDASPQIKSIPTQKTIKPELSLKEALMQKFAKSLSNPDCISMIESGVEFFEKEKISTAEVLERLSSRKSYLSIQHIRYDITQEKRRKREQERGGFGYDI